MTDRHAYHCQGCNAVFLIDLRGDELRFCPVCAAGAMHLEPAKDVIVLCADCAKTLDSYDADHCTTCGAPLCRGCTETKVRCASCNAATAWLDLPVPDRVF